MFSAQRVEVRTRNFGFVIGTVLSESYGDGMYIISIDTADFAQPDVPPKLTLRIETIHVQTVPLMIEAK